MPSEMTYADRGYFRASLHQAEPGPRCWLVVLRVREPAFFVAGPGAGETRPRLCAKESHDDANHGQDYDRQRQRPRAHGWSVRRSTLHVEALPNQIHVRITS